MRRYTKVITAALTMALLLSLAAGTASARNGLSVETTHFIVLFPELTFNAGANIICNVQLDVTLHATVAKVRLTLAGFTNIQVFEETCRSGRAGLLNSSRQRVRGLVGPFHLTYESFTGTLPNVTSVTLGVQEVPFWKSVV